MPDRSSPGGGHRRRRGHRRSEEQPERVRVRVRRRQARTPLEKMLIKPFAEILDSLRTLVAGLLRRPLVPVALLAGGLWLSWPVLKPALPRLLGLGSVASSSPPPEVVTVFVEDPQRTIRALEIWRRKPTGSLLVLQGRPSSQQDNLLYLQRQGKWPRQERGILRLEAGCDTVGQVAALSELLATLNRSGNLTMVTSEAHLQRTLAIARTILGPQGWQVIGEAAFTGDNRPEQPLRFWRDRLRAYGFLLTGLTGTPPDQQCP